MVDHFPLQWPAGKPRTPPYKVQRSQFSPGSRPTEVSRIQDEIRRLGGRDVIVSTNLRLRGDGLPYARDRAPTDCGVAVYFSYGGGQKCFPCDRWATIEENLRAIFKSIEAIRGLERWGSKDFVDAAFTGFAALPAPGQQSKRHWRAVLEFGPERQHLTAGDIESRFKAFAKQRHPDMPGGSTDAMAELSEARDDALREVVNG